MPQGSLDNPIDKIISSDKNIDNICGSDNQTNDNTNGHDISPSKLKENKDGQENKKSDTDNNNDIQYLEREISFEEETKLKNALSNHFIFQD